VDPTDRIYRFLPAPLNPVQLDLHAECFRDLHGEPVEARKVWRQGSFAPRTLIDAGFRELQNGTKEPWHAGEEDPRTIPGYRTPPTEKDIRIHASLNERLAALHRERYGLWPRLLWFLRVIARMPGRLERR
jgi:hypothetical protein